MTTEEKIIHEGMSQASDDSIKKLYLLTMTRALSEEELEALREAHRPYPPEIMKKLWGKQRGEKK